MTATIRDMMEYYKPGTLLVVEIGTLFNRNFDDPSKLPEYIGLRTGDRVVVMNIEHMNGSYGDVIEVEVFFKGQIVKALMTGNILDDRFEKVC